MSKELAAAQRIRAGALATHTTAETKVQAILDKLDAARSQREAISIKRVSGVVDPGSDQAYHALSGDIGVLERMLVQARAELKVEAENLSSANVWLANEKAEHDKQQAQVEYQATLATVREVEKVFCKALRAVALAGQKVGHMTLGSSFHKGDTLHRALDLNIIPLEEV